MNRVISNVIAIFILCGFLNHAYGALVTPSERVTSRLNVRAGPDTNDTIVGQLQPGENAAYVASVPFWYEIRMPNGTLGFVAKSWSVLVEEAAGPMQGLRLGAWNIKKLGHGSQKDFPLVATLIRDHFDVLAIVEVMQKQHGHPGYDALMSELGAGWSGVVTSEPRPNDPSNGNAEFYAVVWRTISAELCPGWTGLRYHVDADGSTGATGADQFSREPAFVCLQVEGTNGTISTDFLLAPYHATWSDGDEDVIADEVEELDAVFTAMAAAQTGEADLLILGDFNLVPSVLAVTLSEADRTEGTGSTLNLTGERTANLYDHLLVHNETASAELVGNAAVIDARDSASSPKIFYQTVSDHLPIVAEWRITGPDDD